MAAGAVATDSSNGVEGSLTNGLTETTKAKGGISLKAKITGLPSSYALEVSTSEINTSESSLGEF